MPLAGRRLSKPVHYHSANLPGCTLPVTSSGAAQSLRPVFTIDARGTSSRLVWLREEGLKHRHAPPIVVVPAFTRTHNSTALVLRTGLEPVCPA